MFTPSDRLGNLSPYIFSRIASEIRELSAQGHDIIRLDIGSPDGMPPPHVVEALIDSVRQPHVHGYSPYNGTSSFRQAVARLYETRFGVFVNPDTQVLPLIGSKEGLANLCLAFLNSGDLVLMPDIGYPAYERGVLLAGADIHWLPLTQERGFLPDLNSIPADVGRRARMLWVNYPNNPTGAVADLQFYQDAVDFCTKNGILLVSDNPYHDITFDGYHAGSMLQASKAVQCGVEFLSFSKTFNMGGWRLGAAVGNADILKILLQMKSNVDTGHFMPIYDAGVTALENTPEAWREQRNHIYKSRRDFVLSMLPDAGLKAETPRGGMYIWACVSDGDGLTYAAKALHEAHVSVTPGLAFGPGGKSYIRMSLGVSDHHLKIAMQRLKEWYRKKS